MHVKHLHDITSIIQGEEIFYRVGAAFHHQNFLKHCVEATNTLTGSRIRSRWARGRARRTAHARAMFWSPGCMDWLIQCTSFPKKNTKTFLSDQTTHRDYFGELVKRWWGIHSFRHEKIVWRREVWEQPPSKACQSRKFSQNSERTARESSLESICI